MLITFILRISENKLSRIKNVEFFFAVSKPIPTCNSKHFAWSAVSCVKKNSHKARHFNATCQKNVISTDHCKEEYINSCCSICTIISFLSKAEKIVVI